MVTSRGVPYWFGPEWVRDLHGAVGRVLPIKTEYGALLSMVSKDGNVTVIQGSIQREFTKWHEDRALDAILLGFDEDDLIKCQWDYKDV